MSAVVLSCRSRHWVSHTGPRLRRGLCVAIDSHGGHALLPSARGMPQPLAAHVCYQDNQLTACCGCGAASQQCKLIFSELRCSAVQCAALSAFFE